MDRKTLIAATAGILVVALVLSMVTVSIEQDPETPGSITVPVGNLGDRVVYQAYGEDGEKTHSTVHEVIEAAPATDLWLTEHPALKVQTSRIKSSTHVFEEALRLEDGVAIQRTYQGHWKIENYNSSSFHLDAPLFRGILFQGASLTLHDDHPLPERTYAENFWGGGMGGGGSNDAFFRLGPPLVTAQIHNESHKEPDLIPAIVTYYGSWDGSLAVAVTLVEEGPWYTVTGDISKQPKTETTYWLTKDIPYPVQIETEWTYESEQGPETGRAIEVLQEYTPGAQPIPWGEGDSRQIAYATAPPDGLRPVDGDTTALEYPLYQAVEDVEQYALDPEWVLWRETAKNPVLVSATMNQGSLEWRDVRSIEWRLVYQGPNDTYEVRTERPEDTPFPVVEGMGTVTVPRVDPDPPGSLLTLASAVGLWNVLDGSDPDYIHWGLIPEENHASKSCVLLDGGRGSANLDPNELLHLIQVGRSTHGPCYTEDPFMEAKGLLIDASGPRLLVAYGFSKEKHMSAGTTSYASEPVKVESEENESTKTMSIGPPQFDEKGAVALPLLVVLVTLWFLPAIQFAATKGFLFLPAFSRIKRSRVLDHRLREQIHSLVRENPGITPSRLKVETGAGWGTIVYHLAVMEREELVASRVEGRHRRFFIAEEVPPGERASLAVLANERTQQIYSSLLDSPGLATPELAQRIGLSSPGAIWHLKRLEQTGLVQRKRDGRYVRYYPALDFRPHEQNTPARVA